MKNKLISIQAGSSLYYPIGENIVYNMATIIKLGEFLKDIESDKRIILIGRGSSGAIIGGIICSIVKERRISFIHIKKDGELSHSNARDIWVDNDDLTVFVDDFLATDRKSVV